MSFYKIIEHGIPLSILDGNLPGDTAYMIIVFCCVLASIAAGYFLGSINSAIVVSKSVYGGDIREYGSGNAGMTNMFRVFGKTAGLLTLAGDVLKTVLSVAAGYAALGYTGAWTAGLFTVLGHMFPIYYRFRGGKGVLASIIVLLLTDWPVAVIAIVIFTLVLLVSRMVSLGSVMAAVTAPLFLYEVYAVFYGSGAMAGIRIPIALCMAGLVVFGHRTNLSRIRQGTENKVKFPWDKKNSEDAADDGDGTANGGGKKNKKKKR
ncbi:MAG: glycerol-3-phosphate 1-O-acyltransferase PlsY [Clostridia bacterium]|nr:glycerol-3-phosphate 1-O-acyltransferase PlsY [Clostridia bacterium]